MAESLQFLTSAETLSGDNQYFCEACDKKVGPGGPRMLLCVAVRCCALLCVAVRCCALVRVLTPSGLGLGQVDATRGQRLRALPPMLIASLNRFEVRAPARADSAAAPTGAAG
jgi:hypothetical protein